MCCQKYRGAVYTSGYILEISALCRTEWWNLCFQETHRCKQGSITCAQNTVRNWTSLSSAGTITTSEMSSCCFGMAIQSSHKDGVWCWSRKFPECHSWPELFGHTWSPAWSVHVWQLWILLTNTGYLLLIGGSNRAGAGRLPSSAFFEEWRKGKS